MADPILDEVNALATKRIMPGVVDQFFKNSPVLAFLKKNRYKVWTGGPQIQENYLKVKFFVMYLAWGLR